MIKLKKLLNEKQQLNEKKDLDTKYITKVHILTQRNNHTEARILLAKVLGNKKLEKFYNAMLELNDVFQGYPPELSKLNSKMEKELYRQLVRSYKNYDAIYDAL
jgi:actin-related protein